MNFRRFHYRTVTSTNDFAKELLYEHNFVVVTADYQTQGRGRNKNRWEGEFGSNVYFSFAMKYENFKSMEEVAYLQGLGALATKYALKDIAPNLVLVLKYPNDVYVKCSDGFFRKISGVLVEHQFLGDLCSSSVLGIGINVNQTSFPEEIKQKATSLKLLNIDSTPDKIVDELIKQIENMFKFYPNEIMLLWEKELNIKGKQVEILGRAKKFTAYGLDSIGRLICKSSENELIFVSSGDSIIYELG